MIIFTLFEVTMIQKIITLNSSDYFIRTENTVTVEKRNSQEDFIIHSHDFNEFVIVFPEWLTPLEW